MISARIMPALCEIICSLPPIGIQVCVQKGRKAMELKGGGKSNSCWGHLNSVCHKWVSPEIELQATNQLHPTQMPNSLTVCLSDCLFLSSSLSLFSSLSVSPFLFISPSLSLFIPPSAFSLKLTLIAFSQTVVQGLASEVTARAIAKGAGSVHGRFLVLWARKEAAGRRGVARWLHCRCQLLWF